MTDEEKQHLAEVEAKQIADARRVKEFLDDPAIQAYMREMDKAVFAEFHSADSDDKRRDVWAKSFAFQSLLKSVQAIVDRGTQATHQRSNREANEARQRGATPRK